MRAETPFRLRACKAIDRERREIAVRFKTVLKAWANDVVPLAEYPARGFGLLVQGLLTFDETRPTGELTAHEPPVR